MSGGTAIVSLAAVRHNLALMRERVAPARVMAVVKDDAYGHGLAPVVSTLRESGTADFGALGLGTALQVAEQAPGARVFAWVIERDDDLGRASAAGIELGATSAEALERIAADAPGARVHLKIDSGLHRAGVLPDEWPAFVRRAAELVAQGRVEVAGVWTHIAEASAEEDSRAIGLFQTALAQAAAAGLKVPLRHLAASAAAFERADARFDMVRVGAFLYGIAPGGGVGPGDLGLIPAMTLESVVSETWQDGRGTVAAVPLGGADGLLAECDRVQVAIGGVRHRVVAVEPLRTLVEADGVLPGDRVVLFGDGRSGEPTLQEWADPMGTIGEEIVTRLSARIPRLYRG